MDCWWLLRGFSGIIGKEPVLVSTETEAWFPSVCLRGEADVLGVSLTRMLVMSLICLWSACLPTRDSPLCNNVPPKSTSCVELLGLPQFEHLIIWWGITLEKSGLKGMEFLAPVAMLDLEELAVARLTILLQVWNFRVKTLGVLCSAGMGSPEG